MVAVGIDIGTTFSCVGIFQNGRVEIIANDQGQRTTPSYVAFTEAGDRLIGDAAKNQAALNPKNTIYDAKRLIGRKFSDKVVQQEIKHLSYKVTGDENDDILIHLTINGKDKTFKPEQISAMVLEYMKKIAEDYLGEKVDQVVITCPAHFSNEQREKTKLAGKLSGMEVLRIINEPTAASMCYGFDKIISKEQNVLIFDCGGKHHVTASCGLSPLY